MKLYCYRFSENLYDSSKTVRVIQTAEIMNQQIRDDKIKYIFKSRLITDGVPPTE